MGQNRIKVNVGHVKLRLTAYVCKIGDSNG